MANGTTATTFKTAFTALLQAQANNVVYASPMDAAGFFGDSGTAVAAWWGDEADATLTVPVMAGGVVWLDEVVTLTLVIQALGRDTDSTQAVLDGLASALLHQAIAILSLTPKAGISDTAELQMFHAIPVGWSNPTGVIGTANRAARYELQIEVSGRLKLTL